MSDDMGRVYGEPDACRQYDVAQRTSVAFRPGQFLDWAKRYDSELNLDAALTIGHDRLKACGGVRWLRALPVICPQ
jgi:hypothetical protein